MDISKAIMKHFYHNPASVKTLLILTAVLTLFPIYLTKTARAQTLSTQDPVSIAPASIPRAEIPGVGTDNIGMAMVRFRAGGVGDTTSISSITVELTGTIGTSDIDRIRVYYESTNTGLFDRGGGDDQNAEAGGPSSFDSGTTKTISLDPAIVNFDSTGWKRLYVAFDFAASADISKTAGCEITSVQYGLSGVGTGSYWYPPSHGATGEVDDYEVTLTATGIAPAEAEQGEENADILKLEVAALDTSVTANIDSIRLHLTGTGTDADVAAGGVILFDDSGTTPGSYDSGDAEVPGGSGSLSGGYVNLNPTSNLEVTSSATTYFVAINIAATASVGKTVGLEVEDPSSDVVFLDTETDPDVSVQYTQQGYIVSSSTTPLSGNTISIKEITTVDITPPTVTFTEPSDNSTDVSITTRITVIFSEDMDQSSISASTFILKDSTNSTVAGTVSSSGATATFTPSSDLDYEITYTATITTGVQDLAGNPMASEYSLSFTTIPDVPEPVAANNRILPGSSDPVKIHIPEPPGGRDERITVQVFTVTGERVATLVNNLPYQQIAGSLPLLWYGKNSRQKKLGPGLYFIQIRTKSYKRVLKVLIVR